MTEDIVKQFIHKLFNSDFGKEGKAIRDEKLPYQKLFLTQKICLITKRIICYLPLRLKKLCMVFWEKARTGITKKNGEFFN